MKTFKTRDSATALLKKMGIAKQDYDLFIYRIEGGVRVDVESAQGHLEQTSGDFDPAQAPVKDPAGEGPGPVEGAAGDPIPDEVTKGDEVANDAEVGDKEEDKPELPAVAKGIADAVSALLKDGPVVLSKLTEATGVKRRRLMRILGKDARFVRGSKGNWSLKA